MKSIKNYLYSIALVAAVCGMTACEDDVVINTGNTDKLAAVDGTYGGVKSEAGAAQLAVLNTFGNTAATGHIYFELAKAATQDVTVNFSIDSEALNAYNSANGTSYTMYPADKVSLSTASVTIPAGQKRSAAVDLKVAAGGNIGSTYAVAVTATASNAEVSKTGNSYIYLVKPLAAIPDAKKGNVRTLCFVEVNDENILNMGEYTMKQSGKPFFDIVSIFAANINVDAETGRVHVFCNDQVSFLLKNADKFIRPLQAKGIKVNLSILGNHDESGMRSLSPEACADFAKELKAYLDIYGLDGVDFDDEYSAYNDENPGAGFSPTSAENYCRLVSECRKAFGPDKLIGVYEYRMYDAPNGSVDGKTAGELVDYMCYGTYQRYVKDREANFDGLTKAKYCPYSLKINDQYDGGWYGFSAETITDAKEAGYGLQVFYNPKPQLYSYDRYFSAVSTIIYGDEVQWTGNYYTRTSDAAQKGAKLEYESYLGNYTVTSSNSLYVYIDEANNPRWWDWGGQHSFNVRIEEKEAGKSYYIYGFGTYPEITNKYPVVAEYDAYDGSLNIFPQTLHEGDAEDAETWQLMWGTYGTNKEATGLARYIWVSLPQYDPYNVSGTVNPKGVFTLYGIGGRYGLDPFHEVDGNLVPPHMNVKYHLTENYTFIKN